MQVIFSESHYIGLRWTCSDRYKNILSGRIAYPQQDPSIAHLKHKKLCTPVHSAPPTYSRVQIGCFVIRTTQSCNVTLPFQVKSVDDTSYNNSTTCAQVLFLKTELCSLNSATINVANLNKSTSRRQSALGKEFWVWDRCTRVPLKIAIKKSFSCQTLLAHLTIRWNYMVCNISEFTCIQSVHWAITTCCL